MGKTQRKENSTMANQPDAKNVQRAIRVQRELDAKVLKRFRADEDMPVKDAYILALQFATRKVELTAEEYRKIADETEKAKAKNKGYQRKAVSR